MKALLKRFIRDEKGLESVEWTLMAALIALGVAAMVITFLPVIQSVFDAIAAAMNNAGS